MKLLFIIGDAAVGKMTVGQELMKITDLRLFHNHMTIEPVIEIFGRYDGKTIAEMRDLIFKNFAASENYGMIFTLMMDFDMPSEWEYLEHVKGLFEPYGTEFYYVELIAPQEIRLRRNVSENRLKNKASKRDIEISNQRLINDDKNHRCVSYEGEITFDNYLRIDNSDKEPDEVARLIKDTFAFAPKMSVMTAEQAELEQMKRYLENYAPCSVSDAVYFFRYTRAKAKRLMEQCVSTSLGMLIWKDGVVHKHTEAACDSKATNAIFVLPGFDPLLVGYEKKENGMVPTEHLRDVYNLQGIIKPVILHKGQCIATWTVRKDTIYIKPFQADNKAACERAEKQIRNLTQCSECRYE